MVAINLCRMDDFINGEETNPDAQNRFLCEQKKTKMVRKEITNRRQSNVTCK